MKNFLICILLFSLANCFHLFKKFEGKKSNKFFYNKSNFRFLEQNLTDGLNPTSIDESKINDTSNVIEPNNTIGSSDSTSDEITNNSSFDKEDAEKSEHNIPNTLILGFKNVTKDLSNFIFNVYLRANGYTPEKLTLNATVFTLSNLRLLSQENLELNSNRINKDKDSYTFNFETNKNISFIDINLDTIKVNNEISAKYTPLALATKNLKNEELLDNLNNNFIPMTSCKYYNSSNDKIQIQGNIENIDLSSLDRPYLLLVDKDNSIINISCNYKKIESTSSKYKLTCNPQRKFEGKLHLSTGKLNSTDNILLSFDDEKEGDIVFTPTNRIIRKNSGGLSTGGIVAILIPSIILLLAIASVAYITSRKKDILSTPLKNKEINNNSVGIVSSTDVVN